MAARTADVRSSGDDAGLRGSLRPSNPFLALVEHCPDFVSLTTLDGRLLYVNPAGRRLAGIPAGADVTGTAGAAWFTDPTSRFPADVVRARVLRDGSFAGETQMRSSTGDILDMEVQSFLVPGARAEDPRLVATIARTLRETRKLRARLAQAERMESMGRLAGGIAHDFNNMLSVVLGFAGLARGRLSDDHPATTDLDEVMKSAERASHLTKQLLTLGKRQVVERIAIDLNEIVRGFERTIRQVAGAAVEVSMGLSPGEMVVDADPGQIDQVLLNLVANARDAMRSGGVLRVATALERVGEEAAQREGISPGPYAVLSVRDSGTGMDRATLERIFEPFFTTKPAGSGTGLGLAMVYGIVRQCGGVVQVESEVGKGSEFRVLLPHSDLPTPRSVRPLPAPASAPRKATVLVVEDRRNLLLLVERCLREAGYDVICAEGGTAIPEGVRPDLLLTDVALRDGSGPQVAAALQRRVAGLRIVYMTGQDPDDTGPLDPAGRVLPKPFKPEQLLEAMRLELDAEPGSAG